MELKAVPSNDMQSSSVPIDMFSWTSPGGEDPSITIISPRKLIADKFEGFGIVPIGSVIAWHKSLTGVPALPDGWVECNGQTLDDEDSLLHGQVIPNLNGHASGANSPGLGRKEKMFIRGGTISGTGQDFAIENITGYAYFRAQSSRNELIGAGGCFERIVGDADLTSTASATTREQEKLNFDASNVINTDTETRPANVSMVFIIRIK